MAPYAMTATFGSSGAFFVYLAIGFAFGFILESSGFGDARQLAAQFYFRELRVVKVMFTAIVVAMLLVFWSTALGLLDYNELWVPPTYLWPGIVGGMLMGYGARLARGCTSSQALSGGALLSVGSWAFMFAVFAGGYGLAWFARRLWQTEV